jgi:ADP-ribose pyrophosphatase
MRVLHSEVLYQGKLRAVRDTLEYPDGSQHKHETIEHPGAVVILPVSANGSIVFVEQYRHSIRQVLLELPAGTLERGEDPAICASRELAEEIGMAPGTLTPLGTLYPAPGFSDEIQHLFFARDLRPEKATPDADEIITTVELSLSQVDDAIKTGRLSDAKSLALFLRARMNGLL